MINLHRMTACSLPVVAATVVLTMVLSATAAFGAAGHNSGRIINGTELQQGDNAGGARWDALVALIHSDADVGDEYYGQFCGGTLIDPEWVVTAAHCMNDNKNPADTDVLLDQLDLTDATGIRVAVSAVYISPDFNDSSMAHDVALLRLAAPVSPNIAAPMELISNNDLGWAAGDSLWAGGWGSTQSYDSDEDVSGIFLNVAREVEMPRIADAACGSKAPGLGSAFHASTMLCAGKKGNPHGTDDGVDTCQGDSGGPLITDSPTPMLVGVVSFGYGCGSSTYGVYARVAALRTWITDTIADPPAQCSTFAPDAEERAPKNARVLRTTFSTITLTWSGPDCAQFDGFDVWQRVPGAFKGLGRFGPAARGVTLRGLLPGKLYSLNVDTQVGDDFSDGVDLFARTMVDRVNPTRPGRAINRGAGRGSIIVGWGASRDNDRVRGYRVYYKVGRAWRAGKLYPANARKGAINRLARKRAYAVSVRAVDYAGRLSAFAPAVTIKSK